MKTKKNLELGIIFFVWLFIGYISFLMGSASKIIYNFSNYELFMYGFEFKLVYLVTLFFLRAGAMPSGLKGFVTAVMSLFVLSLICVIIAAKFKIDMMLDTSLFFICYIFGSILTYKAGRIIAKNFVKVEVL